jgi:hypothetical protein
MIKVGVGPLQPKKHTPPKQVYRKYETWSIDMEPLKPNSLDGAKTFTYKKTYTIKGDW